MRLKSLFTLPPFPVWRKVFFAFSISSLGDEFTKIALMAKVFDLGGSISGLASVTIAQALPSIVIAPLVASFADRGRKERFSHSCRYC